MSVSKLIEQIDKKNIAEDLDEQTLVELGKQVKQHYDEDFESMAEWREAVENGIRLMRQEWHSKSTPWQGASNYKDPILTEASVKFGDKATLELLRSPELVTFGIHGKDPDGQLKASGGRIAEAMNYQIECDMPTWRKDQGKLFYSLPNYGSVFKKVIYDTVDKKIESVRVCYPDFVVNQATESIEKARSFSHVMDFSRNEIWERINSGLWLDIFEKETDEEGKDADKGSNEAEDVVHASDNPDKFIEQQCFFDLDDDGYAEPYIVTIREKGCQVVRVVARYNKDSVFVEMDDEVMPLSQAMEIKEERAVQSFGGRGLMSLLGIEKADESMEMDIVRIEPFQNISHYGFIPAPDGTFLHLGYAHLLGAICEAINTNTNQLTDAATIDNLSGGFLSKEYRKQLGLQKLAPGQWLKTDVPADKLAKGIFPKPAQQPSQTLYSLLKDRTERAQGYLAVLDVSGQLTAQTAPTTALAMIQEAAIPTSAILSRVLESEGEEFQIIYNINRTTFPEEKYKKITGDPNADPRMDFSSDVYIKPTANAQLSSQTQRLQSALVGLEQFDRVLQSGGNPVPLVKRFYEAIDPEMVDEIYPDPANMSPQEKQMIEQMTKATEMQNQMQQLQLQILEREQQRLDIKTQADMRVDQAKVSVDEQEAAIEMMSKQAKALKDLADAEAQDIENQAVQLGIDRIAGIVRGQT